MAFKLVSCGGGVVEPTVVEVDGSAIINIGDAVDMALDGSAGSAPVRRATSSSTTKTLFGVAVSSISSNGKVKVIPITEEQLWEADCTNNTDDYHLLKRHALTDHDTVNNTHYEDSASTGVFLAIYRKGASTDKKLIGKFIKSD